MYKELKEQASSSNERNTREHLIKKDKGRKQEIWNLLQTSHLGEIDLLEGEEIKQAFKRADGERAETEESCEHQKKQTIHSPEY